MTHQLSINIVINCILGNGNHIEIPAEDVTAPDPPILNRNIRNNSDNSLRPQKGHQVLLLQRRMCGHIRFQACHFTIGADFLPKTAVPLVLIGTSVTGLSA